MTDELSQVVITTFVMIPDCKNSASCISCVTAICVDYQLWFMVALYSTTTCLTYFHVNAFENSLLPFIWCVMNFQCSKKKKPAEPSS